MMTSLETEDNIQSMPMTADVPVTANVSVTTQILPFVRLNFVAPRRSLILFWLFYRWASLLPAVWLIPAVIASGTPNLSPLFFLLAAIGSTVLITVLSLRFTNYRPWEITCFLAIDLGAAAVVLVYSGDTSSPYYWYALSPLLAGTLLFQRRGAMTAAALFTSLYLLLLLFVTYGNTITLEPEQLLIQLVGIWLTPLLFGYPLELLQKLEQNQESLLVTQGNLAQQHTQLLAAHDQLEIIHDLTLRLQGASDIQSVQQRVLQVVTGELGFTQALIGLVNPVTQSLDNWQAYPALPNNLWAALTPLPLTPEYGIMARVLLERRGRWWFNEENLVADEALNLWFSQSSWLVLPLVLPEQPVGLLLIAAGGPDSLSEEQLVVLTAVVSQAATALGTIDRTQHLAAEQERNRIARDIHDTVAQSLFGIVFTLDACTKMLPEQIDLVQQELAELRQLADQIRHEVRRSILDTWPSELTQEQFKADLDKYVAHFAPAHAFQIDFTINGAFDRLSPVIRRSLYRISQEALANSARHAGVNSARLTMHVEPDEVYLSISDRGKGFDPKLALAREVNRERFGLRGIRERIQGLGGTCDILSQPGQGAQVLVRIPLNGRGDRG